MFTNILAFIVLVGPLVFIHELGHYLIAKLFNIGVEAFPLVWPKFFFKYGPTRYQISAIPLGGLLSLQALQDQKGSTSL